MLYMANLHLLPSPGLAAAAHGALGAFHGAAVQALHGVDGVGLRHAAPGGAAVAVRLAMVEKRGKTRVNHGE